MAHAPQTSSGGTAGVAALVVTRRLAEYSNWDSSGSLVRAFGPNPIGYIFLDQTGHERRLHVHAQGTRGEAKFWLDPEIELAQDYGLGPQLVRRALRLIGEHEDEIRGGVARALWSLR